MTSPVRDSARTRQRLIDAGLDHFGTFGYSAASVRAIAATAGVNVALVNRYFGSKKGLFAACLEELLLRLAGLEQLDGLHPAEILVQLFIRALTSGSATSFAILAHPTQDAGAALLQRACVQRLVTDLAEAVAHLQKRVPSHDLLLKSETAIAAMIGLILVHSAVQIVPSRSVSPDIVGRHVGLIATALFD